jgi:hypothetical protein
VTDADIDEINLKKCPMVSFTRDNVSIPNLINWQLKKCNCVLLIQRERINFFVTYISVLLYSMDLKQKFWTVSAGQFLTCEDLQEDVKYRIIYAEYMTTNSGPSVLVNLKQT